MRQFGCTTPFGYNQENICTDPKKGNKAYRFLYDVYGKQKVFKFNPCLFPCSFIQMKYDINFLKEDLDAPSQLYLQFQRLTKETVSYIAYGELELMAELGGYVGLFLGVSVLHLTTVFERLIHFFLYMNNQD